MTGYSNTLGVSDSTGGGFIKGYYQSSIKRMAIIEWNINWPPWPSGVIRHVSNSSSDIHLSPRFESHLG